MKRMSLVFVGMLAAACGQMKASPITPDAAVADAGPINAQPFSDNHALAILIGQAWTGTETADTGHGENGSINVTFFSSGEDGYVSARIQFVGLLETVNGVLSGTLGNLSIIADPGQSPRGTRCQYGAQGTRREETERGGGMIEVIEGRYDGRGPAPCPNKAGTFRLQRPLQPQPCMGGKTYTFPPQSYVAVFPLGFPNPWYPFALPQVPFAIPAGQWHFDAVTGDNHSAKMDGTQAFEIVQFALYGTGDKLLATVGPTQDVPDNADIRDSDLGSVTLTEPVVSMKAIHGYTGPPVLEPTHSVYPMALTYSCPVR